MERGGSRTGFVDEYCHDQNALSYPVCAFRSASAACRGPRGPGTAGTGFLCRSGRPASADGGEHLHHPDPEGAETAAFAAGCAAGFAVAGPVQGFPAEQSRAAAACHLARLRLHHRSLRPDRDEQPCDRRRRPDHGDAERRHHASGQADRARRQDRSGASQGEAVEAVAGREVRQFGQGTGGRLGDGDRQSVRPRLHRDGGHRFGTQPRYQCRTV